MAKLGLRQRSFARAWLAGLLALFLALQGLAAALPQEHFSYRVAGHQDLTVENENCGAPHSHDPREPYHHLPCACCILCVSGHGEGGLEIFAVLAFIFTAFSFSRTKAAVAWFLTPSLINPPPGWTSSWSQRAPPPRFA
ncbi:MAG TPA: hypothetical protein VME69_08290 [Methylocella sp.]|nr:hypothetical protein [Methylocella sp.]